MPNQTKWEDLPESVLYHMQWLGSFSPTVHASAREVKGYMLDSEGFGGKVYLTSASLRDLASACVQVANWLDLEVPRDA